MSSLLSIQLSQQRKEQNMNNNTLLINKGHNSLPSPPNSFCGDDAESTKTHITGRRDSLQTVFNDMSIKDYSVSLPENYTIDHSSIRRASSAMPTATAAATGGLTIRNRRQSEAIPLNSRRKSRGLSESYNSQQYYKCNHCGKSYKHPNCLQKHRWEHSEEWELTSKLLLTKHQQVQMLEAAAILVNMDRKHDDRNRDDDIHSLDIKEEEEEEEEEDGSINIDDDDDRLSLSSGISLEDL
ncbi:hypothetical protein BDB01DRAFT_795795 [Pilobolus umbonatus]|nr:hypothetical protein BDB01DRAFT_795795 [Pilobolus umbonatus]